MSIKIIQDSEEEGSNFLLSELILYNLNLDVTFYLDYRKDVVFKAQTFYILYKDLKNPYFTTNELQDPNFKSMILGPIKSKRNIHTTRMFYNDL